MNRYDCQKCGKIWFSGTDPRHMKQKFCTCGGKLKFKGAAEGVKKVNKDVPPVEVLAGDKKGAKKAQAKMG